MWDRIRLMFDNPIFVKHCRSRLRPQAALSALAVVVMLNLCLAYAGYALDLYRTGMIAGWVVAIQIVILTVIGSGQVSAAVNGARTSGILDFHRVSPLTPTELALGFFFGAPIREYALFAATIPFTILCMAFGVPSFRGFLQLMIIVITSSWLLHAMMLLGGLVSRAKVPSGSALGLVIFVFCFFSFLVMGAQFSVNVVEGDRRLDFFGISLPWLPVVLLCQAPVLFFFMLAATRKMESQRLHGLSTLQAIAAMLVFATVTLGLIWRQEDYGLLQLMALYLLTVPAIVFASLITPTQSEYVKGLIRAKKHGKMRLPWWDDHSVNWVGVVILAGIVLAAGTLASTVAAGSYNPPLSNRTYGPYPLALAAAVLTVAYFGFAWQYFRLRFGKRASTYFGLFLFIAWLLPLIGGSIQSMASSWPNESQAYPIFALSPIAGIGMIYGVAEEPIANAVQASAITPILLFTFVFNYLMVGARRRVMKTVFSDEIEQAKKGPELELAATAAETV